MGSSNCMFCVENGSFAHHTVKCTFCAVIRVFVHHTLRCTFCAENGGFCTSHSTNITFIDEASSTSGLQNVMI